MNKKTFLFFLFIMLLIPSSLAYWDNWGNNVKSSIPAFSYNVWATNSPNGNTNFSIIPIGEPSITSPLIDDFDANGKNEIVLIGNGTLYLYNEQGDFLSGFVFSNSEKTCGQAVITNSYGNQYHQIAIISYRAGTKNLSILSVSEVNGIRTDISFNLSSRYIGGLDMPCNLVGGIDSPYSNTMFSVNRNNSVDVYSDIGNLNNFYHYESSFPTETSYFSKLGGFEGGLGAGSLISNSDFYLAWVRVTGTTYKLSVFDAQGLSFSSVTLPTAISQKLNCSVHLARIGAPNSARKFLVTCSNSAAASYYWMYDSSLTSLWSDVSGAYSLSAITAGDINKDGNNEYCYTANALIDCYDSSYTLILQKNFTNTNTIFLAMGEYYDDDPTNYGYAELISKDGIYVLNESANATKVYSFTAIATDMILTAKIGQSTNYTNDIMAVSSASSKLYLGNFNISVCGDGICGAGETIYSCWADCVSINLTSNTTIGYLSNGAQCLNDSWCLSGVCDDTSYVCNGLPQGAACSDAAQCISKVCQNGICGQVDMVDNIQEAAGILGFRSTASKLLLGIIIMFFGACLLGVAFASAAGAAAGLIGVVMGFFGGMVVSVFVLGWAALWYVVILVIIGIVGLVIYALISHGGGSN